MKRLALLILLALPATAHAGTYEVRACDVLGTQYANASWAAEGGAPGLLTKTSCPSGEAISVDTTQPAADTPNGRSASLVFRAPAGATIATFRLSRRLLYHDIDTGDTHPYFLLFSLGSTPFAGAGDYRGATRDSLHAHNSWYGYNDYKADLPRATVTPANFGALAGYTGNATSITLTVGCYDRQTPCKLSGGRAYAGLFGAAVTINDPTVPALSVAASGLLAGGPRSGSDPVTYSASDNSGIKLVEIVDVTDANAPRVVGSAARSCVYRTVHPCTDASGESLRPTMLEAGQRQIVVRVTDAGGNVSNAGPFPVDVATPSDRGSRNGSGATDTGTVTAAFLGNRSKRTVRFGLRPTITGVLRNGSGEPVSGARLRVDTRALDSERFVERRTVTTDSTGRYTFKAYGVASRVVRIGWAAFANDVEFAASDSVTMRVRASATLKAPRSVRLGRRLVLSGKLRGKKPPGPVRVVAEGAEGSRFRPFARGRARKGRYSLTYRFLRSASRGHTFRIRVLIAGRPGWPYSDGLTRTVRVRVR